MEPVQNVFNFPALFDEICPERLLLLYSPDVQKTLSCNSPTRRTMALTVAAWLDNRSL